jgi:hypothetical protein
LVDEIDDLPTRSASDESLIVREIMQIKQFFVVLKDPEEFS